MKQSQALLILTLAVILLTAAQASLTLFLPAEGSPFLFSNLHGEDIEMYGRGIYANEAAFKAPIYLGSDAVNLFVTVPLLAAALIFYRRGSLRGGLLLVGLLAMAFYNAASLAFGATYNNLFLLYLAMFSTSLFAFILAFTAVDLQALPVRLSPGLPRRGIIIISLLACLGLLFAWLPELVMSIFSGQAPTNLLASTTDVTAILDLGIIAPTAILTAVLVARRVPLGYLLGIINLISLGLIGIIVAGQSVAQTLAGITLSPGVFIGKAGSFIVMSLFSIWLLVRFLRSVRVHLCSSAYNSSF